MPPSAIDSRSHYVVFSQRLGLIGEESTASDAVRKLMEHLRIHPGSDAAVYKSSPEAWRIF